MNNLLQLIGLRSLSNQIIQATSIAGLTIRRMQPVISGDEFYVEIDVADGYNRTASARVVVNRHTFEVVAKRLVQKALDVLHG